MSETPPPFQESDRCDVCNTTFTTFRRRHHCRCCGKTLCSEHSSNYMALPQFGIYTDVRVCSDCFNKSNRSEKDAQTSNDAADAFSRLGIGESKTSVAKASSSDSNLVVPECKCGMPLCICVVPIPEPAPAPLQNTTVLTTTSNPKPKKPTDSQQAVKKPASSSTNKSSSFLNSNQLSNNSDKGQTNYDINGEGLREAIKNSDATAVKELLSKGVDANYCDKNGMTLLHLATLFNQTEITFILMDHGASIKAKNAQGETPIDCAPTMLQFKMRSKMEELAGIANRG